MVISAEVLPSTEMDAGLFSMHIDYWHAKVYAYTYKHGKSKSTRPTGSCSLQGMCEIHCASRDTDVLTVYVSINSDFSGGIRSSALPLGSSRLG